MVKYTEDEIYDVEIVEVSNIPEKCCKECHTYCIFYGIKGSYLLQLLIELKELIRKLGCGSMHDYEIHII